MLCSSPINTRSLLFLSFTFGPVPMSLSALPFDFGRLRVSGLSWFGSIKSVGSLSDLHYGFDFFAGTDLHGGRMDLHGVPIFVQQAVTKAYISAAYYSTYLHMIASKIYHS